MVLLLMLLIPSVIIYFLYYICFKAVFDTVVDVVEYFDNKGEVINEINENVKKIVVGNGYNNQASFEEDEIDNIILEDYYLEITVSNSIDLAKHKTISNCIYNYSVKTEKVLSNNNVKSIISTTFSDFSIKSSKHNLKYSLEISILESNKNINIDLIEDIVKEKLTELVKHLSGKYAGDILDICLKPEEDLKSDKNPLFKNRFSNWELN